MSAPAQPLVAILLAAGRSTRMRGRNKLLLEVGGQPMIRRAAQTLLASRIDHVVAVLGHEHGRVAAALGGMPLRTVINHDHASGQMSSVRAGLTAIEGDPAGIMVALADQPALEPAEVEFLIDAFLALPEPKVLVPVHGRTARQSDRAARRVPPEAACRRRRLRLPASDRAPPELVARTEVPNPHYFRNVDTPVAYAAWADRQ